MKVEQFHRRLDLRFGRLIGTTLYVDILNVTRLDTLDITVLGNVLFDHAYKRNTMA